MKKLFICICLVISSVAYAAVEEVKVAVFTGLTDPVILEAFTKAVAPHTKNGMVSTEPIVGEAWLSAQNLNHESVKLGREQFFNLFKKENNIADLMPLNEFIQIAQAGKITLPGSMSKVAADSALAKVEKKPVEAVIITAEEKAGMQRAIAAQASAIQKQDGDFKVLKGALDSFKQNSVTKTELDKKLEQFSNLSNKVEALSKKSAEQSQSLTNLGQTVGEVKNDVVSAHTAANDAFIQSKQAVKLANESNQASSKANMFSLVALGIALALCVAGLYHSIKSGKERKILAEETKKELNSVTEKHANLLDEKVASAAKLVGSLQDMPATLEQHAKDLQALNSKISPVMFDEAKVSYEALVNLQNGEAIPLTLDKTAFGKDEEKSFFVNLIKISDKQVKLEGIKRNKDDTRADYVPVTVDSLDSVANVIHRAALGGRLVGIKPEIKLMAA